MSQLAKAREVSAPAYSIYVVHARRDRLPPTWKLVHGGDQPVCECHESDGAHWIHAGERMSVIESVAVEEDGKLWHHVSVARPHRMPDYADLQLVRRLFIGEDRESYMVFPPASRYVNYHPYALHLFTCLESPQGVLPPFERGGTTL